MPSTFYRTLSTLALAAAAVAAQATPVTIGALSSNNDGSTNLISDTLNGREWVRWDTVKSLSYAQTVAATAIGGSFAGFHIAHNADAQAFVDALLAGETNACSTSGNQYCNTSTQANYGGLTGDTYLAGSLDYVWFLSDNGSGTEVGLIELSTSSVLKYNEWANIGSADSYSGANASGYNIGWLLYRDAGNNVPEPGSVALVLLALAGAAAARRRQA